MKKKILILGAAGMAGHMLYYYLLNTNMYLLTALLYHEKINTDSIICDVRDQKNLSIVIDRDDPDIIVNCIGALIDESKHHPDNAILLNSWLPHYLVNKCRNSKTKLIHISTDCVFSGEKGCYAETDPPDAVDIYGRTKALGEIINNKDATLRASIVGPELKTDGKGLFHWYMNQTGEIEGYQNALWSGITTYHLAVSIEYVIEHNLCGLFNVTNGIPISKLDLLRLFFKYFHSDVNALKSNQHYSINKSLQKSLKFDFKIPEYEVMIIELKKWMDNNISLYPQYSK